MYWHPEVIEITKDGGAYRYLDAVSFEKTEYQAILKKEDGRLILDTRFVPGLTVSLLEDDLYLLIGQRKFRRSEESRIPEVRQYLELEKQRKEQQLKDLVNSVN